MSNLEEILYNSLVNYQTSKGSPPYDTLHIDQEYHLMEPSCERQQEEKHQMQDSSVIFGCMYGLLYDFGGYLSRQASQGIKSSNEGVHGTDYHLVVDG